jgi:hypothetical protein
MHFAAIGKVFGGTKVINKVVNEENFFSENFLMCVKQELNVELGSKR